jgi:hypothetical protein
VISEWVPSGQNVNTTILKSWLNCMEWKENNQDCGEMGGFCIRTTCHPINALSAKQFVANKHRTVCSPPYLSDLAPCDFFPFPQIKSTIQGTVCW